MRHSEDRAPPGCRYELRAAGPHELQHALAIDDATVRLYAEAGVIFELGDEHPFVAGERCRWREAIDRGELFLAWEAGQPVGFFALGRLDGRAYLDQISVRPERGRRGIGGSLLEAACERCRARADRELWLTTYAHLPWNRPFYERHGFQVVPPERCGESLSRILDEQRAALPHPDQRVAMVRTL